MGFKENLREELRFQDMKQKELSEKTGISVNTLRNYINDHNALPNIYSAVKIAQALETTVEELVLGKKQNQTKKEETKLQKNIRLFSKLSESNKTTFLRLMEGILKE